MLFFVYIQCIQYQLKDIKMQEFIFFKVRKTGKSWVSMVHVHKRLGIQKIKNLRKEQIKKYKITER